MKNQDRWKPTKFALRRGRLRASRDRDEIGVGSRLVADLVASQYQLHLASAATGRLLDLGCGKAPLYGAYSPYVTEITCVDWGPSEYVDLHCDLSRPLPFEDRRFDTIILSDVLEHVPDPGMLWREMSRVLAPRGKLIMNVPFYYAIHEHPHDYFRYTNFALERFAKESGLAVMHLASIGGLVEVLADLSGKILSKLPLLGAPLAIAVQSLAWLFGRTRAGMKVAQITSRNFPLGYFLVAQRVEG